MGRWTFGGAYYFDGAVDEVRISNIERSFAPMADGTISGHVYAPDGISPLADVEVKVSGTSNKDYTDSQGFYSLTTNAPAVVVEAYYPHHNLGTATVSVISNQTTTQNFTLTERPAESATQWMLGYAGLEDDPDTLSLWHFDEGTGSTGVDSKGVCSFTKPYGSFPYWIEGKFGKALDFDGSNTCAFAFYSNKEYAFGTHAFTVEAWIMPRAGVDQVPNAELVDNTQFWALRYGSGLNSLEGIVGETDPDLLFDTGSGLMTPGEWQHVAVTYGGPGGKLRLWRNGKVVFQTTVDPSTVVNLDRSSPQITLGRSTYMGAYYFDGLIDEVRISRVEREFGPTGGVVCATIGDAKKQVPNTVVSITNPQVVTATFGVDYGGPYYYVEDQNRSNGIRVWGQNAFYRGDTVLVQGTLQLVNGEMTLSQDSVQLQDPVDPLGPLGMNGRAIGGGESGLQPAVSQGIGLNTIGLLVRTTGVVRGANYPTFYVDDGSGAIGTDGVQGVKVFSLDAFPSDGQHAIVAGVCSAESVNGIIRPVIITRPNDSSFPNDVVAF